jgi:hypothetical protein
MRAEQRVAVILFALTRRTQAVIRNHLMTITTRIVAELLPAADRQPGGC